MRELICVILLLSFAAIAHSMVWQPELKVITPELGFEYGIGDEGHTDFRLGLRYNIPLYQNFILGFCFQSGYLMHDTDDLFYEDDYGFIYDKVEDWSDLSYDFLLGWEFSPHNKVNPYLLIGVGFVSYSFTAKDSYGLLSSIDVDVEGTATKVPLILGCDFKLAKYIAITPCIKLSPYSEELEITISDYEDDSFIGTHKENLNEWRGLVHLGVNISFPISIPRHRDTDGDGVWDEFDMCPDTPPGTIVNERGCLRKTRKPPARADMERDFRDKGVFVTTEIFFEFNSDEITPESYPILDDIGEILQRNPDWRIEIAGHTDSIGTESYNKKLSQQRAKAVKNYLVKNFNIIRENLSAQGYGESTPIAENSTAEGRALNRRVEFKIINR
ncbi:hypothetical protein DRQ36_09860 [bacterium]|nr:MAG: hypothetical protein DRQ36_09860 [bacterium]